MKMDKQKDRNSFQQYLMQARPLFNRRALFSDGTPDYRIPAEPVAGETVEIRFRTAHHNCDSVWIRGENTYEMMQITSSDEEYDYYAVKIELTEEPFSYCFHVFSGRLSCFYDRMGISVKHRPQFDFQVIPGFQTPDWAKGAVMYQILVDRFYNGDPDNDVLDQEYYYINGGTKRIPAAQWNEIPTSDPMGEFYGGDLEGVRQKLDYLASLGIEVLYLNPVFLSPSVHKYDTQDYDYIDPHFGIILREEGKLLEADETDNHKAERYISRVTDLVNLEASNDFFALFMKEVHDRGMKVILDGVFNHCGSFHKWLDAEGIYEGHPDFLQGAFHSRASSYNSFFSFDKKTRKDWPGNDSYESWWNFETLPKLNFEGSEELCSEILRIAEKWVSPPYDVDGWRLDVAADLGHSREFNHGFWKRFRETVKKANPQALILAEHYGDPKEWLNGQEWDTIMNYAAFMEPVTWYLTGMEKHGDEFRAQSQGNFTEFKNSMTYFMSRFPTSSLYTAMNQLSNHDHSRFLTRTSAKTGRVEELGGSAAEENLDFGLMRAGILIQMTWPGAPTLYYGDEAGVCGFTDPDNRRTFPWGKENTELQDLYRELIRMHKHAAAFCTGSFTFLESENDFLVYARFTRDQQFIVAVYTGKMEMTRRIPVTEAGIYREAVLKRRIITTKRGYSLLPVTYAVENGTFEITLQAGSAVILECIPD